jgi:hypothetical protein
MGQRNEERGGKPNKAQPRIGAIGRVFDFFSFSCPLARVEM